MPNKKDNKFRICRVNFSADFQSWQDFIYYCKMNSTSASEEIRKFIKKRLMELKKKVK